MSGCRPSRCNFKGRPGAQRFPHALVADLQTNYSLALYGHKYRIDLSRLRVLWPALLTAAAHRSLFAPDVLQCGKTPRLSRETHLFVDPPKNNLQAAAIWVHQPNVAATARELVAPASHSWVEVSHCYYSSEASHGKIEPMWFFLTPGSGLFLNVGRTAHLDSQFGGADERQRERMHRVLVRRCQRMPRCCDRPRAKTLSHHASIEPML